jgi:SAM-dependent methyltransferase
VTASASRSAQKAAELYDQRYAERYRAHDDTLTNSGPYLGFVKWLQGVCDQFDGPIDALELGCGTGRYFSALRNVRNLVGLDASADMLAMARTPYRAEAVTAERITLIHGDLFTQPLEQGAFDLVYSIGVLAEHAPLNQDVASRVHRLLKAGGRFAFSTVHPDSPSIGQTAGRSVGRLLAMLPGPFKRPLRERLLSGGMYADEVRIRDLLKPMFEIESLERFISEAHLHCLCVARKAGHR